MTDAAEHPVFRPGGISYLRIPAVDPGASATFYEAVFGWRVRRDRDEPAFEDGTGHVIGHFVRSQAVAGEGGVRPYVFVETLDETLEKAVANGAEVVEAPYPEGDLWVATADGRNPQRLLKGKFLLPAWSDDGKAIAVAERVDGGKKWDISVVLLPENLRTVR